MGLAAGRHSGGIDRGVARPELAGFETHFGNHRRRAGPTSLSMRGLNAPTQMPMSCAGAGRGRRQPADNAGPQTARRPTHPWSHSSRITWMPSSSASTLSPGPRRDPPIVSMASQAMPAPMPSSKRPWLRTSRLAAARATTAGGRERQAQHVGRQSHAVRARGHEGHQLQASSRTAE